MGKNIFKNRQVLDIDLPQGFLIVKSTKIIVGFPQNLHSKRMLNMRPCIYPATFLTIFAHSASWITCYSSRLSAVPIATTLQRVHCAHTTTVLQPITMLVEHEK